MDGEEEAIAPVLRVPLGLTVSTASDIDTNAPGAFTGMIPRDGSIICPSDSRKADHALRRKPDHPIGAGHGPASPCTAFIPG